MSGNRRYNGERAAEEVARTNVDPRDTQVGYKIYYRVRGKISKLRKMLLNLL